MKKVVLFFCLILNISYGFSQTKFFSDNDGIGINISNSGGNQELWASKTKIIKSKNWNDHFYVIWADTGTFSGYSPDTNPNYGSYSNANIFAIKMIKSGSTYQKDTSFGNSGLVRITDRFDQLTEGITAFPYNNGFVIVYSTSSSGNESAGFIQYYDSVGNSQISSSGDGGTGNTSFKLDYFSTGFPVLDKNVMSPKPDFFHPC